MPQDAVPQGHPGRARLLPPVSEGRPVWPPQNGSCAHAGEADDGSLQITAPARASSYVLRLKQAARDSIAFTATADADARALFWFVDGAYVGSSRPGETFYWKPAMAGDYRLRVVDDHGRSDERPLPIRLIE